MALVKAVLQGELIATYGGHSPDPMKPGKDIAKAFKNYLMTVSYTHLRAHET